MSVLIFESDAILLFKTMEANLSESVVILSSAYLNKVLLAVDLFDPGNSAGLPVKIKPIFWFKTSRSYLGLG